MADLDIAAFLRAQLDEREAGQVEPYCSDGWHANHCALHNDVYPREDCDCGVPALVLADVAAKRQIIALHERAVSEYDTNHGLGGTVRVRFVFCGGCQCEDGVITGEWPCDHLRLLALPYAGHQDFREEWKP